MVDITDCDKEPIHIPGSIQDYAVLFVLNPENHIVEQVSSNIEDALGIAIENALGFNFSKVLQKAFHNFPEDIFKNRKAGNEIIELGSDIGNLKIALDFNIHENCLIVEVEFISVQMDNLKNIGIISQITSCIESGFSIEDLTKAVVRDIQRLTCFDRVMIYQFDEDWCGSVISEERSHPGITSYLSHRFPSSDIPKQARIMLEENSLRIIPNVHYTKIPIQPVINPRSNKPVDLGRSLLRSPSPVHLQYLKNMNVGASLTISILQDGKLWGIVACHNERPKKIEYEVRAICRLIGKILSGYITTREFVENLQYQHQIDEVLYRIVEKIKSSDNLIESVTDKDENLLDLFNVKDGSLVICYKGKWKTIGDTPAKGEVVELMKWIRKERTKDEVFVSNCLSSIYPRSSSFENSTAGAMILDFSFGENIFIAWFRPEILSEIIWAGKPEKIISSDDDQGLHPRFSFESWREEVKGRASKWKECEIQAAIKLKNAIIENELVQQLKDYQFLTDAIDEFIWIANPEGVTEFFNKKWYDLTGMPPITSIKEPARPVIHPDDQERMYKTWYKSIQEGIPYYEEARVRNTQGEYRWILTRAVPIKDKKGKIYKWYGTGIDITASKKSEEDLKSALKIRDEFISLASHELKTPITSLGLLLELSQRTLRKSNTIAPYIEKSIKELKRLRYLVDDLLDVSKISSGKMDLLFNQHDLKRIITGVLERYQDEKRLSSLLSKFEKMPSFVVECDEFRIEQVLTNLISNALKYGDNKAIDIDLLDSDDSVVFIVKDHGIGISPEDQGRIFDRFERVGKNVGISGLGLGLYICKNIIDAHKGEIKVTSDLGKGTTFEIKLHKKLEN